jgi:hypothetical protein
MKRFPGTVAVTFVLMALSACGQSTSRESGAGEAKSGASVQTTTSEAIGKNTYRIAKYGLTVTAPDGWYVADSELMTKLMDAGADVATSTMDARTKAAIDGSVARTTTLFTFMEAPPGSPREYIPAVLGVTERVDMLPGISRGSDYFFHARKILKQSAVPITISDAYSERMIDGHSFDRMDLEMGPPGASVTQRYFAARHGAEVVVVIQSYRTEDELAVLDKVLDSAKLDW